MVMSACCLAIIASPRLVMKKMVAMMLVDLVRAFAAARAAENRLGCAAAEGSAHVRTFALLYEHQAGNGNCGYDMNKNYQ